MSVRCIATLQWSRNRSRTYVKNEHADTNTDEDRRYKKQETEAVGERALHRDFAVEPEPLRDLRQKRTRQHKHG